MLESQTNQPKPENMLGDIGSIASLAGVAVSLLGLGFAILQITKLRGETRAAREAAEAARNAIGRDLVIAELTRLNSQMQVLKGVHLSGDRARALDLYGEIIEAFLYVRRRHPGVSEEHRAKILEASTRVTEMESRVGSLDGEIPTELANELNHVVVDFQFGLLTELEDQLQDPHWRSP